MNFNLILAIGAAATLAIPKGYVVGNVILVVCGLFRWKRLKSLFQDAHDFRWFLLACMAFVLVNGLLLAYHGEPAGDYEYLIPFLIAPTMLNGLRGRALNPNFLFAGFAIAALAAGFLAIEQVWISGAVPRAVGHIKAIPFGNLSIMAGTVSLMGLVYSPKGSPLLLRLLFALGLFFGLIASLLSGSKGGWLALLAVAPVILYLVSRTLNKKAIVILLCMLMLSVGFALVCPGSPVLKRLSQAIARAGNPADKKLEGSFAPRLAMWRYVLQEGFWRSPLLGSSRTDLLEDQKRAVENGSVPGLKRAWRHFHNELLDTLVTKGVVGVAVLVLLFFSAFRFFFQRVRAVAAEQRVLGWLGVIVLLEFVVFSLTDVQFQLNSMRNVFVFTMVVLVALILSQEDRQSGPPVLESPASAA